ncbi:YceI family protein [Lysobacter solisilvae (ex Woo and Kim 2020)]|uniref:Polyisoprenoid-binding protein n=1 Tax=Agrilutibacter terrestris TaxID=2865112 RepID=A0A7H0FYT9_9GAMM|nr:YceI family protein [Lysobacter terrestris]QNP41205.1 polyisoprenoid-binding protein [Lysobacter terrestris]
MAHGSYQSFCLSFRPSRFGTALLGAAGLAALASAPVAAAGPASYAIDPVHTRVVFLVEHAGFSRAMGAISGSSGTLRFDRDDWRSARLDVTVPITRLDLGDAKWNAAVLASNLLDGERHPDARFVSRDVTGVDAEHARVCGELTLRGVTGPVCMDVTFNALKRHPLPPFRRTAGFSATATLSRKAFGITAWPSVIGDEVKLLIEAEAVRQRGPGADAESGEAPPEAAPADADKIPPERESDPPPPSSL